MDLVSNLASTMLSKAIEGNSTETTSQVDLNDKTFANLLDKQLNNNLEQNGQNFINTLGIPSISGLDLGDLDGHKINELTEVKPVDSFDKNMFNKYNSGKDFSMEEVLTLFNPVFETKPTMADTANSGLFDFERKTAANQYSKYAKNIVTNLSEFVSDALKIS